MTTENEKWSPETRTDMSFILDALFQTSFEGIMLINSAKRIKVSSQLSPDWSLKQSLNIHKTRKATCASFRQGANSVNIQKYAY